MLELFELRFRFIGRFVEEQTIRFDSLGNFIQIDGKNNNTGGSSGSGKSTVFNALDYLLGFNKTPATVLQSRKIINPNEEPIWVHGIFTYSDKDEIVVITRSKSIIKVTTAGKTFEKNKAEEKIDEILGMPRELFRKVIHKRQKEGGFFLDLTPAEMHSFLMDCCGLSPFKKHYTVVDARITKLEEEKAKLENDLKSNQTSLSSMQDAILALGLAPIKDMHEEVINELKEKYDRSAVRFEDVRKKCESLDREFAKTRPDTINVQYDGTIRENLEKRRKEIETKIRGYFDDERSRQENVRQHLARKEADQMRISHRISNGDKSKEEAARIAAEIKSIRAQKCPTCLQDWKTEGAVASEGAKLAELGRLKDFILDAALAKIEKTTLENDIAALKNALAPVTNSELPFLNEEIANITGQILDEKRKASEMYDQQNAETKAALDSFMAGQIELRAKHAAETDQARGQMDIDYRVLSIASEKLRAYNAAKERYEQTFNELNKKADVFEKNIIKCRSDLETTLNCLNFALETKKAIKMYVSFSFDEALEAIGDKATKIIRCIPNTSNATIQFEGTKETAKGVVKEEVNAVISVDGEIGVPIKSLSGGERTSTDHAVDLAVIDYIETKTGKGLNIFILDEPFDGLGTVEVEMVLEVFKNANINKKLIIVDHNPEVKQMVQYRAVVTRDGLTSRMS